MYCSKTRISKTVTGRMWMPFWASLPCCGHWAHTSHMFPLGSQFLVCNGAAVSLQQNWERGICLAAGNSYFFFFFNQFLLHQLNPDASCHCITSYIICMGFCSPEKQCFVSIAQSCLTGQFCTCNCHIVIIHWKKAKCFSISVIIHNSKILASG